MIHLNFNRDVVYVVILSEEPLGSKSKDPERIELTLIIIIIKLFKNKGLAVSKVVSAMDMRQNFGTLLNQVAIKDEEIVIERAGKPLARLVSMNSATSGKLDFRDIGKLPNDIWVE